MARFDVYKGARGKGYLLDCQSDWLDEFDTRVVVPLMPLADLKVASRLNPIFEIDGQPHIMSTQLIFAIPTERLGQRNGTLDSEHFAIITALDTLIGTY
jgi:toxin CcdB